MSGRDTSRTVVPTGAIAPREFCLLLKEVDRQPPRLSRDLEPDFIGIDLKQRILDAVIAADPPADRFEAALLEAADALDIPSGSARGVCSDVMQEWRMAHSAAGFMDWMRAEAAAPSGPRKKRRADRAGGREPSWRDRPDRPLPPPLPPAE